MARLANSAQRGYVIAIIEYRPSSVTTFPGQVADAITATRWLLHHARDFHHRPAAGGDVGRTSSGGHPLAVAVTGHDPSFTDEEGWPAVARPADRCLTDG